MNVLFISFLAGFLTVLGFAPFGLFPLPVFSLALLFGLWLRADTPRVAARLGFAFGLGLFTAGIGWVYVAMHETGQLAAPLAALATLLFAAFYALFPAAVGWLQARLNAPLGVRASLVLPALWVLLEWLRGLLFTGFPWLVLGYSQAADSPLAGYAAVFGVYGVSLLVAVSAGLLAGWWQRRTAYILAVLWLAIWLLGYALSLVNWTSAQGEPFKVSLLQGNISQQVKFEEGQLVGTLETYRRLLQGSDARLVVLPETALPLLRDELPESYLTLLRDHLKQRGGDVLIGAFERDNGAYYNSVFSLGASESQSYKKNHLVPFGEFIPLRFLLGWFVNDVLQIPMSDLSRGGEAQPALLVAGQQVAVNICFEDVFGEELVRALPSATVLVNVSNDAWYGHSHAAMQHNQIAQMRALETGRMMLRATNTGVTSIIGVDGRVQALLPQHEEGVLTGMAQGYAGSTPYVRWGNQAVLLLLIAMLGGAWLTRQRAA